MTADNWLFFFICGLTFITIYYMITNNNTIEQTKEMIDDEEIW